MKWKGTLTVILPAAFFLMFAPQKATASACTAMVTPPVTCSGTLTDESGTPDSVVVESMTLASASNVTIFTTSYGGGTNLDGTMTNPGGFQPNVTLFDTTGFAVATESGMFSPIGNTDPSTGWNADAYLNDPNVAAGTYFVILTDTNNMVSAAFTGFGSTSPANFYTLFTGNGGTTFQDAQGNSRTGNYALNIEATSLSGPGSSTPEPATLWLVVPALAGLTLFVRRRRNQVTDSY